VQKESGDSEGTWMCLMNSSSERRPAGRSEFRSRTLTAVHVSSSSRTLESSFSAVRVLDLYLWPARCSLARGCKGRRRRGGTSADGTSPRGEWIERGVISRHRRTSAARPKDGTCGARKNMVELA